MKQTTDQLQSIRQSYRQKKVEEEHIREQVEFLRQKVTSQQAELQQKQKQKQKQKQSSSSAAAAPHPIPAEGTPAVNEEQIKEMEEINLFLRRAQSTLQCDVKIVNAEQFSIVVMRRHQIAARIEIRFIPSKKAELKVTIHPSVRFTQRRQLENRLPTQQPWEVGTRDLKEAICRIFWILSHVLYQ